MGWRPAGWMPCSAPSFFPCASVSFPHLPAGGCRPRTLKFSLQPAPRCERFRQPHKSVYPPFARRRTDASPRRVAFGSQFELFVSSMHVLLVAMHAQMLVSGVTITKQGRRPRRRLARVAALASPLRQARYGAHCMLGLCREVRATLCAISTVVLSKGDSQLRQLQCAAQHAVHSTGSGHNHAATDCSHHTSGMPQRLSRLLPAALLLLLTCSSASQVAAALASEEGQGGGAEAAAAQPARPSAAPSNSASLPALVALASGQSSATAGQNLGIAGVGAFKEWITQNGSRWLACQQQRVSPFFTIHYAAVNVVHHPDACGR